MNKITLNITSNINSYTDNKTLRIIHVQYKRLVSVATHYNFETKKSIRKQKDFMFSLNRMKDFFRMRLFE